MEDKEKKKDSAKKSLLMKILSFSPAREQAEKAKPEPFLDKQKIKKFKLKRD